ncbi:MAG: AraC family transcriptional regulator [Proteobacteria bacterium]|nr:AraC family transcriptional regulator [Pseudomonadota bacterium]
MSEAYSRDPPGDECTPVGARTGRFVADDPFLHEEAVRPVEAICIPLGRRYRFDMAYLATPNVMLHHASIGAPLRGRGSLPPGMLSLCVPVRLAQGTLFGKSPLLDPEIPCSIGGALDVVFAEGQAHFVVMIALDLLRRTLPAHDWNAIERAAATLLLPASTASLERFGGWLGRVLQETLARPQMLQFPAAVRLFEEDLVRQLAEAIDCRPPKPLTERPFSRARGLDRALDYLHSRPLADISLPVLCEAVAVSQRTLERAFQDTFDMSARDYLKLRRLHAVRRQLMATGKGEAKIGDIAYAHGFYELGRFAAAYTRLFGERPSETLRSAFPELRAVLIGA